MKHRLAALALVAGVALSACGAAEDDNYPSIKRAVYCDANGIPLGAC